MGAAFTFRAGAGFPGAISRQENSSIEPVLIDASAPPLLYGVPVVIDPTTQGIRPIVAGDSALTTIFGILVRPFPTSQFSVSNFGNTPLGGAGVPPTSGPADVLTRGYIIVSVVGATKKDSLVDIWFAASSGSHVQGGFEGVHTGGSSLSLPLNTYFNGVPDANGLVELAFNI